MVFEHLILLDGFLRSFIEGKIGGKKSRGRPRRSYFKLIRENVKDWMVGDYSTDKNQALNNKKKNTPVAQNLV